MLRRDLLAALPALLALPIPLSPAMAATRLAIVAAENFYGDIARQLAGPDADITSILDNPDQDPHLFEATASVARALSAARIVIVNGADYDPWMDKLLKSARSANRTTISVAALAHKKPGDNPHLWYDTTIVAATARAITESLDAAEPANKAEHATRLRIFLASIAPINAAIASLRAKYKGQPISATEPVFGYMADAIGLDMRHKSFQLAVMNDTEPSASDVARFETDLHQHRLRVLIYNSQATSSAAQRLLAIAKAQNIPVVGVTETMPAGMDWQSWMTGQLDALAKALGTKAPG